MVVFIFGNTCKTVFEAIIFLFAMHPFDVGDRCEVDGVQVQKQTNFVTYMYMCVYRRFTVDMYTHVYICTLGYWDILGP